MAKIIVSGIKLALNLSCVLIMDLTQLGQSSEVESSSVGAGAPFTPGPLGLRQK